ncbi:MAG: HTTM domain-containing protein [Bdellovibrio sp.]|nr:HTTM domain-containing protein [Bdellovibrio sp.]
MKLSTIQKSLDSFFFKPQPVHSVVLLRIALGVIVIIGWFGMWQNLHTLWGVDGIVSLSTALKYSAPYRFNLFAILPEQAWVPEILAILLLLAAVSMTVGLFTRASVALTFIILFSFHNRNTYVLNSADIVLRNFLFLMFFAPCGDMFSMDRWLAVRRGTAGPGIPERSPWALRLMQIQFSVIYISTVLFKMKGQEWADGTAVYFATRLDEFLRVPVSLLNNYLVLKFLTWSTLVVEFMLGTLVWVKELRYWVLLAGVGLHLGIEVTMSIPLFEWIMIATMLVMVDSRDLELLLIRLKNSQKKYLKASIA